MRAPFSFSHCSGLESSPALASNHASNALWFSVGCPPAAARNAAERIFTCGRHSWSWLRCWLALQVPAATNPAGLLATSRPTSMFSSRHPEIVYAGNRSGGVLRSLDGGATWAPAGNGLPPLNEVLAVAVDPIIPARVYAWVQAGGLFVSADRGGSWTAAETGEAARRSGIEAGRAAMAVDRVVPGRVYIGNSGVVQIDTLGDPGGDNDD